MVQVRVTFRWLTDTWRRQPITWIEILYNSISIDPELYMFTESCKVIAKDSAKMADSKI